MHLLMKGSIGRKIRRIGVLLLMKGSMGRKIRRVRVPLHVKNSTGRKIRQVSEPLLIKGSLMLRLLHSRGVITYKHYKFVHTLLIFLISNATVIPREVLVVSIVVFDDPTLLSCLLLAPNAIFF